MPRFKHPPLASAAHEIRLLSLYPSGDLDDIHCTLVTHRLDNHPVYCALSYEWGDPDLPMDIKVNGSIFQARHNLWLFLHRMKAARQSSGKVSWNPTYYLWIDALCVDQTDVAERSAQVQLMGRIYNEAYGVIVWLGWSDRLDTIVTATLAKETSTDPVYGLKRYANFLLENSYQQTGSYRDANPHEVYDFVSELCKKTYWTRRWIVQEILMAQKVLLVYGEQELPWAAVCMMFDRYTQERTGTKSVDGTALFSLEDILESTAAKIWRHQSMRKASRPLLDLATLLHDYRPLHCEALYDNVYSLKGLAMDETLDTDYSISTFELFSRVFAILLQQDICAFRNWTSYAADCGLVVQPLRLPYMSAWMELVPPVTPIPLRRACKVCVNRTMEFATFEEVLKRLMDRLDRMDRRDRIKTKSNSKASSSPSRKKLRYVSRFYQTLKTVSKASHYVFEVWQTVVERVGFEVGEKLTSRDAIFIKDNMKLPTPTTIDSEPADRGGPAPTITFGRERNLDRNSPLCVTWSNVRAGDWLCHLEGRFYLIVRENGSCFQVVGPAWALFNVEDAKILEKLMSEPGNWRYDDHTLLDILSKQLLHAPHFPMVEFNDGSSENFEVSAVEVRFDVKELIRLLQVNDQMRNFLGLSNWKLF